MTAMKQTLHRLFRGDLAPLTAALMGLVYIVAAGFRGLGDSTIDWLDASRELAADFAESPSVVSEWNVENVELIELFAALIYLVFPTGFEEWTLFVVSVVAGAAATGMVFAIGRRLAGTVGGWLSLIFLLTSAPWIGTFTRLDPTFLLLPVLLASLLVWYATGWAWWLRVAVGAPLFALGTMLWPGMIAVLAVILVIELLVPLDSTDAEAPGLVAAPTFEADRLLIPVVAALILLANPLFWPAPVDNLGQYVLTALEQPPAELLFRGSVYPPDRPPFYAGIAWIFEQLPLALALGTATGIVWTLGGMKSRHRRFGVGCAALAAGALALPVIFRDFRPLGAEVTVLFVAVGVPIAALVTCRFFTHALGRDAPSKKVRQIAIVAFLLAGVSILVEAPRAVESPETFRSPMTARITGWSAGGDMPLREKILPRKLIETSGADRNNRLYTGGWQRHIELYERMGLLDDIATTSNPDNAQVAIRPIPPISAGRFTVYPAEHIPPLEGADTTVIPDIHRPAFLIDRVPQR